MSRHNDAQPPRTGEPTRTLTILAHNGNAGVSTPKTAEPSQLAWAAYGGQPPETTEAMFRAVTGGCLPG